jgi:hypothetical protein
MRNHQINMKIANEIYLREHPEFGSLLRVFSQEVYEKKPRNLVEFATEFFTQPNLKGLMSLMESLEKNSEAKL